MGVAGAAWACCQEALEGLGALFGWCGRVGHVGLWWGMVAIILTNTEYPCKLLCALCAGHSVLPGGLVGEQSRLSTKGGARTKLCVRLVVGSREAVVSFVDSVSPCIHDVVQCCVAVTTHTLCLLVVSSCFEHASREDSGEAATLGTCRGVQLPVHSTSW